MSLLTEGKDIGSVFVNEFERNYNREEAVASAAIDVGQVLKVGGSAGTAVPVAAAGDTVIGVSLAKAASGERFAYIARGPAVLRDSGLEFYSGVSGPDKATLRGKVIALGFVLR